MSLPEKPIDENASRHDVRLKSSFHFQSGDGKLTIPQKLIYLLSLISEISANRTRSLNWNLEYYCPELNVERLTTTFGDQILSVSPSRALCYDFLLHKARTFLGDRPRLIDLGCGKGNYSRHLRSLVEFSSYKGFDIDQWPDWEQYAHDNVLFSTVELGRDVIDVDDTNAVFSQSVLEHVQYDKEVFHLFRSTSPLTLKHLHMVPATRSWYDHGFHGYRRYGPREINSLLDDPNYSNGTIFALGNWLSRAYHRLMNGKRVRIGDVGAMGRKAQISYDKSLSPLENLARRRGDLMATDISDVSFFAIAFKQNLE